MTKSISNALVIVLTFIGIAFSADATSVPLKELQAQADNVLSKPNISARKEIDIVFTLVDRLLEENQPEEAEKYIAEGLEHFPWNLKYQMIYAEMLAKSGEQEKANEKASLVLRYAETDELIAHARQFLNKTPLPEFEKITALPDTNYCVVLVPLQGCDKWLISRIKEDLSATLGIPVYIQTIEATYPPFSRDRRGAVINEMRSKLLKNINDIQLADVMTNLKMDKGDLSKDDNVIKLMRCILSHSSNKEMMEFDTYLESVKGKSPQWNADQLRAALLTAVKPYRRNNVAYLGITPVDIYADDYNFLFGYASRSSGVMSYRRFTADFNDDIPNQDRLVKRTLMQSLSSIGLAYGIKRCTNPTCARAYPNSLSEHDAKDGTLCSECRDGFKRKFGQ